MTESQAVTRVHTELSAVVLRCTCGDPASHAGEPCPAGEREDMGIISEGDFYEGPGQEQGATLNDAHASFISKLKERLHGRPDNE